MVAVPILKREDPIEPETHIGPLAYLLRMLGVAAVLIAGSACTDSSSVGIPQSEPLRPCEDPVEAPGAFDDMQLPSVLDFEHSEDGLAHQGNPLYNDGEHLAELSAGVVAADLDGDGWDDLFFPQSVGASALYWGAPDFQFEAAGPGAGLELAQSMLTAASAADYDGDGLLDLVISGTDALHLMHNEGDRTFRDVTAEVGMVPTHGLATTTAWADVDSDGDLDLYVGVYGRNARPLDGFLASSWDSLWRNDGESFVDIASSFPYPGESDGAVIAAGWRDLDDDGDLDLVQANDVGELFEDSFFWENLGRDGAGVQQWRDRKGEGIAAPLQNPMGIAMRDLDGDGVRDLWFSNIGRNQVFQGDDPWSWVDRSLDWAEPLPTGRAAVSWSVVPLDLDGDGDLGLFLTYGPLAKSEEEISEAFDDPREYFEQSDRFLRLVRDSPGVPSFEAADSVLPGPMLGNARGVAQTDLDRNGTPDLIIGNIGGPPTLLVSRCTAASRLVVELRDDQTDNRFAIGATVEVEAAGRVQKAEMLAGGPGTFSGEGPVLRFGLGDASQVDFLTVRWPDGALSEFTDLCGHCRVVVARD